MPSREYTNALTRALKVYEGSDGDKTKALYVDLEKVGPIGCIAMNLFRAQKNSARAKVYRGRRFKNAAYESKQWAMGNLCAILERHADAAGIRWGWGRDEDQPVYKDVLFIDLPTGQVSFHTETRGKGPTYPGTWDGKHRVSTDRIVRWTARVLSGDGATEKQPELI